MANKNIKVALTVDDRKITLEGPEDFVKAEVQRFIKPVVNNNMPQAAPTPSTGTHPPYTEKDLIAEKKPKNQSEIVAVLGFFLTENGQAEFSEADIKRAYIRAGSRPPKIIAQALRDAKNKFDFIESGTKRGIYKLSAHGDRFVRFDLPRAHE